MHRRGRRMAEDRELNFKEDMNIDPDALDIDWLEQADLVLDYSLAQNEAGEEKEAAKLRMEKIEEKLKETKAEISLEIRRNPEDHKLPRVTDASVTAAVEIHPKVKAAKEKYYKAAEEFNQAKNTFNNLYSAVKAFDHRKSALEHLVRMLGMQYFAAPSVERHLGKEWTSYRHKKTAQTKREAREKVKSRRRTT